MVLGVYWYFGFPTDMYKFDYFVFKQGYGGHADNPAQLITIIRTPDTDEILDKLKNLVKTYKNAYLHVEMLDNYFMRIGTGSHNLHDYDFLIIKAVEKIFNDHVVEIHNDIKLPYSDYIQLYNKDENYKMHYPKKSFLQVVGSPLRKNNAETLSLRMDCNLPVENKDAFIKELALACEQENVNVLYYLENNFGDSVNLMLSFTNGRQGLKLKEKQLVIVPQLETRIENLTNKYKVELKHKSGFDLYPKGTPIVVKMVDEEYIL